MPIRLTINVSIFDVKAVGDRPTRKLPKGVATGSGIVLARSLASFPCHRHGSSTDDDQVGVLRLP